MRTFYYILLGLAAMIMISQCDSCFKSSSKTEEKKDEKLTLTEEQSSLLRKAEIDGSIKVKEFENEVWVTPLLWDVCNYQAKTNLAYFCAIRCGNAQSSTNYSCTVYNNMTGKKLAKWDEFWGFEMED